MVRLTFSNDRPLVSQSVGAAAPLLKRSMSPLTSPVLTTSNTIELSGMTEEKTRVDAASYTLSSKFFDRMKQTSSSDACCRGFAKD